MELLRSNTEGVAEPDGGTEGASEVGAPHSPQNRMPGVNGFPHIMQNVFIVHLQSKGCLQNRIMWLGIILDATLHGIVYLVQSPYQGNDPTDQGCAKSEIEDENHPATPMHSMESDNRR